MRNGISAAFPKSRPYARGAFDGDADARLQPQEEFAIYDAILRNCRPADNIPLVSVANNEPLLPKPTAFFRNREQRPKQKGARCGNTNHALRKQRPPPFK
jgi:hypothetical protein